MNLDTLGLLIKVLPVVTEVVKDAKELDDLTGQARLDKLKEIALGALQAAELGLGKDLLDDAKFAEIVGQVITLVGNVQSLLTTIKS
ncbi:MAG: hypothetical protein LC723_05085 [Actinobacteria bacterium]|nr:hypothetical protein [Actinomycetota bacterium]